MKFTQAKIGRIFVVKLEDKDKLPDAIEEFSRKQKIKTGVCLMIGGIGKGKLVAGPERPDTSPIIPVLQEIKGVNEILGIGTIFPDEKNLPRLHMHAATGRKKKVLAGCIRPGITVWKIVEFIILEFTGSKAARKMDKKSGFLILEP